VKLGTITLAELLRAKGYSDKIRPCVDCENPVVLLSNTPRDERTGGPLCSACEQLRHAEAARLYYKSDVA
jgi:recombinational DNA repair protein (RecF pathway)